MKPFQIEVTCEEHWKLIAKELDRLECLWQYTDKKPGESRNPDSVHFVYIGKRLENTISWGLFRNETLPLITLTELRAMETPF